MEMDFSRSLESRDWGRARRRLALYLRFAAAIGVELAIAPGIVLLTVGLPGNSKWPLVLQNLVRQELLRFVVPEFPYSDSSTRKGWTARS